MAAKKDNKGGVNFRYFKIFSGKLVENVSAETEGATTRVNAVGNTVHELSFTGYEGYLKNVSIVESEKADFGKQLQIHLEDMGENVLLQLPVSGGYAYGFLSKLPNADLTKPMELRPYEIEDKATGKKRHFLVIYQDGEKVEAFFTKENPNDLPQLEEKTIKGKKVWDDSERIFFFEQMLQEAIVPELQKIYAPKVESIEAIEDNFLSEINESFMDEIPEPETGPETKAKKVVTKKAAKQ
jgi:hypothetical protein